MVENLAGIALTGAAHGSYESLTNTCSGNALTETDSMGDAYAYRRVSSVP